MSVLWDYEEHNLSQLHIPALALLNTAIFAEMKQMYADTVMFITVQDFYCLVLPLYVMGCSDTLKQPPVSVSEYQTLSLTFPGADVAEADLGGFVPVHIRASYGFKCVYSRGGFRHDG